MGKTISDYTLGSVSSNVLRQQLRDMNVKVDAKLDKLIRQHECGDFVSYNELGKHIFR